MSAILRVDIDRRRSYMTAASLVLSAWLALAIWSLSPYAEWLDHAQIENIAAPPTVRLVVFTLGWTLMIIAMMLPSTLLLLDRCLGNKPLSTRRIAPAILAYLAVWTVFGTLSYLGDGVLHEIVEQVPALAGVIAPSVLLLAGVYQLTPMKRACLSRCRPEGAVFNTLGQSSLSNFWSSGAAAWCLLPRKLLGVDAADVRYWWSQSDLDAGSWRDHGCRTNHLSGLPALPISRLYLDCLLVPGDAALAGVCM